MSLAFDPCFALVWCLHHPRFRNALRGAIALPDASDSAILDVMTRWQSRWVFGFDVNPIPEKWTKGSQVDAGIANFNLCDVGSWLGCGATIAG